ncbi:AAA family ATPase [Nocardia ignorata]|uniref:AAA family ATPase n=1 Tax=Nocardia ignorata TaxID=145285 RepID=UPI003635A7E5
MSIPKGYADIAHEYRAAGWRSVLPLPPGMKSSPPEGFTGHSAPPPDDAQVERWCAERPPNANVALRLPDGVLAFDVDNYGGKRGLATLAEFEADAGCEFPPTWSSTARRDGSGQRFYRVPLGQVWRGKLPGSGVELLQAGHRYAMAYPSVHPNGNVVRWYNPAGNVSNRVPRLEELAELPAPLVHALVSGVTIPTQKASRAAGTELLKGLADGAPSPAVIAALSVAIADLSGDDGSRHDLTCGNVARLVRLGEGREPGVPTALATLKAAYVPVVGPDRAGGERTAADEFDSLVKGGGQLIAADRVLYIDPELIDAAFAPGGLWHRDTPYPGQNRDDLRARGLLDADGKAVEALVVSQFAPVSAAALAEPVPPMEWLIRGVWPRNSFGPMGGEKKTLKTYNLLAMAVAVASGESLFGEFEVKAPGPVLYYVGEGGQRPFQRRLQAVAQAYGVDLGGLPISAVFQVGSVAGEAFTDALRRNLDALQPALVVLDPLYAFHPPGVEAQNLYERGRMLAELSGQVADEAALIVADHFKKNGASGPGGLDLDSIAQAGMGQWADSWVLQRHREAPDLDSGAYRLEAEFGSRQWGGARYEIDWNLPALGELESGEASAPKLGWSVRSSDGSARRNNTDEQLTGRLCALATEQPFELTKTAFAAAIGGNRSRALGAVDRLLASGRLELRRVPQPEGATGKPTVRDRVGPSDHGVKVRLEPTNLDG